MVGAHPTRAAADAIERLFVEDGPRLWRAVLAYAGDRELASDAVAETFTLALERRDDISSPQGWVWRVAFRLATSEIKRRRRSAGEAPRAPTEDPMDSAAVEMLGALRRLSPRQRGAVVLHYYADQPVNEVARILGSTPAAVRVHLMRGRRRLRELLEETDG